MSWWEDNVTSYVMRQEVVGTIGAVLGALNAPGASLREKAFNVGAGFAAAIYLGPVLVEALHVPTEAGRTAFIFMVGLLGMNILVKTIEQFKRSGLGVVLDWIFGAVLRIRKTDDQAPPGGDK